MRFGEVVLCENETCGAILRLWRSGEAGPISVTLQHDALGSFIVCPRCLQRTPVDVAAPPRGNRSSRASPGRSR